MRNRVTTTRRFFAILVIFSIMMAGCSRIVSTTTSENPAPKGKETERYTIPYFSEESELLYGYFDFYMDWTESAEKLDSDLQDSVNELCVNLCEYFNKELGAEWKTQPIEVYAANVAENLNNAAGCYYNGKMYIDYAHIDDELENKFKFLVAHELVHFLKHCNTGEDAIFAIKKQNGYVGSYLEEAFVESLTRCYFLDMDTTVTAEDMKGGYRDIRLFVDLLRLALPETYNYFFNDDIDGLKKKVDELAKKHLVCVGSPFEKWASALDLTYSNKGSELADYYRSITLSFLAVNTSSEKTDQFVSLIEEEGMSGVEELTPFMY